MAVFAHPPATLGTAMAARLANVQNKFLALAWWKQVLFVGTLAMLYIFFAGWLGVQIIAPVAGWGPGAATIPGLNPSALNGLFVRWDSGYYTDIVLHGYTDDGDERAFFPLYPLLVRTLAQLTTLPMLWSGWLISVVAFLTLGILLYKWMRLDYLPDRALLTTLIFYAFPMAFYYLAFYAEPVFMLLSVASLYFARRGQFEWSGLMIALAGTTRPQAFLLGVPYVIEFYLQRQFTRTAWVHFLLGGMIAPAGMVAYLLFTMQTGRHLHETYLHVLESGWATHITLPWITLIDGVNAALFGIGITPTWFSRVYAIHDLIYALMGLALSVWAFRYLRLSTALFLLIGVITFYTTHGPYGHSFDSIPRHLANLPAIYPALALLFARWSPWVRWAMLGFSAFQLGVIAAWFASGRWVS